MEQGCRRQLGKRVEVVCEAIKWHAILITNDGDSKPKTANGRPQIARKNRNSYAPARARTTGGQWVSMNIAAERPVA